MHGKVPPYALALLFLSSFYFSFLNHVFSNEVMIRSDNDNNNNNSNPYLRQCRESRQEVDSVIVVHVGGQGTRRRKKLISDESIFGEDRL